MCWTSTFAVPPPLHPGSSPNVFILPMQKPCGFIGHLGEWMKALPISQLLSRFFSMIRKSVYRSHTRIRTGSLFFKHWSGKYTFLGLAIYQNVHRIRKKDSSSLACPVSGKRWSMGKRQRCIEKRDIGFCYGRASFATLTSGKRVQLFCRWGQVQ